MERLAATRGSIRGVTLADNVERVVNVLERAEQHGPPVLLGHSRGGITATAVATARPDLVDRLVSIPPA